MNSEAEGYTIEDSLESIRIENPDLVLEREEIRKSRIRGLLQELPEKEKKLWSYTTMRI